MKAWRSEHRSGRLIETMSGFAKRLVYRVYAEGRRWFSPNSSFFDQSIQ